MSAVDGSRDQAEDARSSGGSPLIFDVVVIGAGFGGMYAVYKLRAAGLSVLAFEKGDGPGGTWYWNRYPGCRVDVESMVYSYSFDSELQQEWEWPQHFSPQPDIERYANHVADRFDLRGQIEFGTTVTELRFDDAQSRWHVSTDRGEHVLARYVVAATGALDATHTPDIAGAESFCGETFHTSLWPKDPVDLAGKRVGVIGTGSSGVQFAPVAAAVARHLTVFQRTANFCIPANTAAMDPGYQRSYKQSYEDMRAKLRNSATAAAAIGGGKYRSIFDLDPEERAAALEDLWDSRIGYPFLVTFADVMRDAAANDVLADFVRDKIRGIVEDPAVGEMLCPTGFPIGAKRICVGDGYYEMYNRDNVSLVDLRVEPIEEITREGLRTASEEYPLDVLVFATGFDAMTGSFVRMNITGSGGRGLGPHWADGPRSYLGLTVAGFPNLFLVHGPGSPSVLAQMIMGAETEVDWIAGAIDFMREKGFERMEATAEGESEWGREVDEVAEHSLYRRAESWYTGANIEGKARAFSIYVGGFDRYAARCEEVAEDGYVGFAFS